jgi:hypothetical protein
VLRAVVHARVIICNIVVLRPRFVQASNRPATLN